MLDRLTIITIDGKAATRVEHWCGEIPRWSKALRTWGEAGVVKTAYKTTVKRKPRGIAYMFVGYALNHETGIY